MLVDLPELATGIEAVDEVAAAWTAVGAAEKAAGAVDEEADAGAAGAAAEHCTC